MNIKRNLSILALGGVLLASGGISAYAGTAWEHDSVVLPGFNGSALTNKSQVKKASGNAGLRMSATGGTQIDARTYGSNNGAWVRDVQGGSEHELSAPQSIGSGVRLQFSSNLITTKAVTLDYTWRSN